MSGTANVGDLALRLGDGPSWAMVRGTTGPAISVPVLHP